MKSRGSRGQTAQGLSGHLTRDGAGSQAGAVWSQLESHVLPGWLSPPSLTPPNSPIFSRGTIHPDFSQKSLNVAMSATNQNQRNKASKTCRLELA